MTTLRTAAQQALEAMESAEVDPHSSDAVYKAITALKAALAEPLTNQCGETCERAKLCAVCARGLAEPVQEPVQEPVAWMYEDTLPKEYPYDAMWPHSAVRDGVRMFPVFAPPQRKPLTEEEILSLFRTSGSPTAFARAIKRAIWEKNNG